MRSDGTGQATRQRLTIIDYANCAGSDSGAAQRRSDPVQDRPRGAPRDCTNIPGPPTSAAPRRGPPVGCAVRMHCVDLERVSRRAQTARTVSASSLSHAYGPPGGPSATTHTVFAHGACQTLRPSPRPLGWPLECRAPDCVLKEFEVAAAKERVRMSCGAAREHVWGGPHTARCSTRSKSGRSAHHRIRARLTWHRP